MDPSGRAATGIHDSAYEADATADTADNHKGAGNSGLINLKVADKVQEVNAVP